MLVGHKIVSESIKPIRLDVKRECIETKAKKFTILLLDFAR